MSIGVARTERLAKIASQVAKPDGLVVVDPATELEFLHELPVALMWGVGLATEARLARMGVTTIGRLAESSPESVERLLGHAAGRKLTALAWNRDPRQIQTRRRAHSAGAQSALGRQPAIERVFQPTLHHLADRVGARLHAKSLPGRTITVRVRFPICARSRARSRCQRRFLQPELSLRSPRTGARRLCGSPRRRTISLLAIFSLTSRSACNRATGAPARASRRRTRVPAQKRRGAIARRPGGVNAIRKRWGASGRLWVSDAGCALPSLTSSDRLVERELSISPATSTVGRLCVREGS